MDGGDSRSYLALIVGYLLLLVLLHPTSPRPDQV